MDIDESVELDLSRGSNGRSISLNKSKIQTFDLKSCSSEENLSTENNNSNHSEHPTNTSPPLTSSHSSSANCRTVGEAVISLSTSNFKNSLLDVFPIVNGSDSSYVPTLEGHHLWERSLANSGTFSPAMSDLIGINGVSYPFFR